MPHTSSSARMVVIGSSNTDMVIKSDRLPAPGETVSGGEFIMVPGGKGANQAVAAARQGARVTFVACVGDDLFGSQAIEGYQTDGITTDAIRCVAGVATGTALILVGGTGENIISVAPGANQELSIADIDRSRAVIEEADIVLAQLEIPLAVVEHAALLAADAGTPFVLDPAPAPESHLPPSLLERVTYLTPNETEATRLTGIVVADEPSARQAASRLLASGPQNVLITMGSKGVLIANADGMELMESVDVHAVDTTAAGDAFNGGLGAALATGLSLRAAVRYASTVGALSVTRMGAQPSLPTRAEVEAFTVAR